MTSQISVINGSVSLLPRHWKWLRSEARRLELTTSALLRRIVDEIMQKGKAQ